MIRVFRIIDETIENINNNYKNENACRLLGYISSTGVCAPPPRYTIERHVVVPELQACRRICRAMRIVFKPFVSNHVFEKAINNAVVACNVVVFMRAIVNCVACTDLVAVTRFCVLDNRFSPSF